VATQTTTLPIYLTADIGPALATLQRPDRMDADWAPTISAVPLLCDAMSRLEDQLGQALPLTWFVRADTVVEQQFGSPLHVVRSFLEVLHARFRDSHELGWMPHLREGDSASQQGEMLGATHAVLRELMPALHSVRAGNLSHSNAAMAMLDQLGLRIDCSAVPGREKHDPGWSVDWRGTPAHAYQPSRADYRVPGDPHWGIIEVPMTAIPMQADYDARPLLRYVNPSFHGRYLWPALEPVLREAAYLVCLVHPDELHPGLAQAHPMVGYSAQLMIDNLQGIVREAIRQGRAPVFKRLRQFTQAQ
jgi:hypothetical protein